MSLAPGTRLGPYEVVSPLGAGGMGEVYRARDARLGREVAIKILPAVFSVDPERLSRFEQEARAAAALSHPNIAVVYDVGVDGTAHYLVQELLTGASLRDMVSTERSKTLDEWLLLAAEIADALAAAHRAGIVHRDIKPENAAPLRSSRTSCTTTRRRSRACAPACRPSSRASFTSAWPGSRIAARVFENGSHIVVYDVNHH